MKYLFSAFLILVAYCASLSSARSEELPKFAELPDPQSGWVLEKHGPNDGVADKWSWAVFTHAKTGDIFSLTADGNIKVDIGSILIGGALSQAVIDIFPGGMPWRFIERPDYKYNHSNWKLTETIRQEVITLTPSPIGAQDRQKVQALQFSFIYEDTKKQEPNRMAHGYAMIMDGTKIFMQHTSPRAITSEFLLEQAHAFIRQHPQGFPPGLAVHDFVLNKSIRIEFPKPMFHSGPVVLQLPNLEKPNYSKVVKEFKVPVTAENLAKGKAVSSSDPAPLGGKLDLITDGDAGASEGKVVELATGHQWVQIDLAAQATIHKIVLWHNHKSPRAFRAVIVQISDDPEFKKDVTTVWNSDEANITGLGAGKDPTYIETNHGRVIDGKDAKGRYVRFHSSGNPHDETNNYAEIEVWASAVK